MRDAAAQSDTAGAARPFVSVIVPVFNSEGMIGECLEALLDQDYPKDAYEIIIVDNDSTDRTAQVIGKYSVRYLLEDRVHTSYGARNSGARAARGEWLAFCDAAPLATPGWLRHLLGHAGDGRYAGYAGPCPVKARTPSVVEHYSESQDPDPGAFAGAREVEQWGTGNLCVSAADFRAVGGFQEDLPSGADHAFCRELTRRRQAPLLLIGDAVQWHRPRTSLRGMTRSAFRIGYGQERICVRTGRPPKRPLKTALARFGITCARVPVALVQACFAAPAMKRNVEFFALGADLLIDVAGLLGRFAARLGIGPWIASGM